jgi:putative ABC transport system permease protein
MRPSFWRRIPGGWSYVLRIFARRPEDDVDAELRFHFDERIAALTNEGFSPDAARAQAIAEFGDVEAVRTNLHAIDYRTADRRRRADWRERVAQDVRIALRGFRSKPAFATTVVLVLALGIGVSAAMFTIFKTVLVDRLPIRDQDQVVIMHPLDRGGAHLDVPETYLSVIARDSALVRDVAGVYHLVRPEAFTRGSDVVTLNLAGTSANYFEVLGVTPVVGRLLQPEDEQPGAPTNMVLSYSAWSRKFNADPSVVGQSLTIPATQKQARIVGVAPAGFGYPAGADVWIAMPPEVNQLQVDIVARLAPHVTIRAAQSELFALTQRAIPPFVTNPSQAARPEQYRISGVTARYFADTVFGDSRPAIVALTVAVALLLLIGCVNIGNLSLVRVLGRTREIAVRSAIGASSMDILRLVVVENALLGLLGGALGAITAVTALRLVRYLALAQVPRLDALGSVAVPVIAASGIAVLALLLFGVLPGVVAARIHSYSILRADSRSGAENRLTRRARQWLVATQIALAVVMLNGAGLMVRTLARLESVDLGYHADHLSILGITGPQSALPPGIAAGEAGQQLVRRLEATPGVVAATPILSEPFIGQSLYIVKLGRIDQSVIERERNAFIPFEYVGSDYFRTLGIPIVRGRPFSDSDARGLARAVVVNETLARQLWPDADAIGKQLKFANRDGDTTFTVIGVVRDTRYRELRNGGPVVYVKWDETFGFPLLLAVRTAGPLAAALPGLRAASREFDSALIIWKAQTMDELLDAPLAQPRLSALLLSGFSLAALLLSAIGLYGVIAAGVRRQTREIGVRMALGAMPHAIRRLVFTQVFGLVGLGVTAGLVGAIASSRLLQSLLFQVSPVDPKTLVGVCVLLTAIAILATYLPARRAARIDPVEALRAE